MGIPVTLSWIHRYRWVYSCRKNIFLFVEDAVSFCRTLLSLSLSLPFGCRADDRINRDVRVYIAGNQSRTQRAYRYLFSWSNPSPVWNEEKRKKKPLFLYLLKPFRNVFIRPAKTTNRWYVKSFSYNIIFNCVLDSFFFFSFSTTGQRILSVIVFVL